MVVFTCDLSTQEEETGRLDVEGQPGLYETLSQITNFKQTNKQHQSHTPSVLCPSISKDKLKAETEVSEMTQRGKVLCHEA